MYILTKEDLKKAIGIECGIRFTYFFSNYLILYLKLNPVALYLFLLRTAEYYRNKKQSSKTRMMFFLVKFLKYRQGLKLGFSIPDNVFDLGLQLPHYGTIVVNANARVGKNCRLHVCTNIGTSGGGKEAPKIGDNVYIAPGVKLYGNIEIANNISIAANSAVGSSFLKPGVLIGGVPARELKDYDNSKIVRGLS